MPQGSPSLGAGVHTSPTQKVSDSHCFKFAHEAPCLTNAAHAPFSQ